MNNDGEKTSDWECFLDDVSWLLHGGKEAVAGEPAPADATQIDVRRFPNLSRLVGAASATPVSIEGVDHQLLTWNLKSGDRRSWLCLPPTDAGDEVHPDHRALLHGFGGIVERSNEPDSWLLNCNDALTAREATQDASYLADYAWILEDLGTGWPIVPEDYYSICAEANGNDTICHRREGDVLMFAPDHAFDHLEVLDGCPPYSLYRIVGAPRFVDWVEEVARQWLDYCDIA